MQYFLAIDIGASSGRHILGSVQDGKLVLEEIYRFSNGPKTVEIGGRKCLQWDYERLFGEIVNGLKRAGELGKIPYSVGIDTWGVDYALLDEKDEEIGEATAKKMKDFRLVVWTNHGIYGTGKDMDEAFGLIETVEKTAQIYMLALGHVVNEIPDEVIKGLAKLWGLTPLEGVLES